MRGPGRRLRPPRDQRGQVAGLEAVIFGLLVLVVGTLVIANAWAVVDAKEGVVGAAREAARAYVEAPDPMAAPAAAQAAAVSALTAGGRSASELQVEVSGALVRCGRVQVRLTLPIHLVGLGILGRRATTVSVRGSASELVDPYRSGLPGPADCAG